MRDFLRAEWKTLLLAIVGFGTIYALFFREQTIHRPDADAEVTIVPGEQALGVALGTSAEALRTTLGEPTQRRDEPLDQQAWLYPERGLTVFVHAGEVNAVRVSLPPAPQSATGVAVLPGGVDVSRGLRQAVSALGEAGPSLQVGAEWWRRYAGVIAVFDKAGDDLPVAVIVVADRATHAAR